MNLKASYVRKLLEVDRPLSKILLIMKITIALLLMACIQVHAEVSAQRVTLSQKNASFQSGLKKIEKQTGYFFWYDDGLIRQAEKVSVDIRNLPLTQALDLYFANQPLTYSIIDKSIVIKARVGNAMSAADVHKAVANVNGRVVDSLGSPLSGATVEVKNGQAKTSTDEDGRFTINVLPGDVLVVSFVNYQTVEVKVSNPDEPLRVVLKVIPQEIQTVVVTALGIKRQERALSYNVQTVTNADITNVKNTNFVNNLVGKVAGLTVNSSSSGIGGAAKVVMRGTKSIEQSNNALYVIDGVPMISMTSEQGEGRFASTGTTEGIADINPDDIESISVLTGAAAAALYGSAAANGAVLVNTKKGVAGKINVSFSTNNEWGTPFVMPQFQDKYGNDGRISSWGAQLPGDAEKYNPKDFLQTARVLTNSVSVSGGTDKNQTYFSAASVNGRGLVPNNSYNRYNFNFRNTTFLLNDRLRIDGSANMIIQDQNNMVNQGEYMNPLTSAYLLPRGDGLARTKVFEVFDPSQNIYVQNWGDFTGVDGLYNGSYAGDFSLQNPYWVAYRNLRFGQRNRYILTFSASYDLHSWSATEKWDIAARVRSDNTNYKTTDERYASTISIMDVSKNGFYGQGNGEEKQTYIDVLSNLKKNFGADNQYALTANIGASRQITSVDGMNYGGPLRLNGIPNVFNISNIDQTAMKTRATPNGWKDVLPAVFGSVELGYNNYLFLTLTGRNEWPSQLAGPNSEKTSYFYWSAGLSTVITDMISADAKANLSPTLSYLKLRSAYSTVANPFQRWLINPTYSFDEDTKTWKSISTYPVNRLDPERTNSFEVGMSSRWLRNRLSLDLTYYHTNTKNQTIRTTIAPSSGYDAMYIQTGNVQNKGVELGLGYNIKNQGAFRWSSYFTMGYNDNKIKSLAENFTNPITGQPETIPYLVKSAFGSMQYVLKSGGSMGDVYTSADFKRNSDGNIYVDPDGGITFENYSNLLGVKLGSVLPDYTMGWKNEIGFNNISLGATLAGRIGGIVVSMTEAALDQYGVSKNSADARDAGGVIVNGFPYDAQKYYETRGRNRLAQYYTYEATNFRIQEAYLAYRIPKTWLKGIADATISLSGRNLLMLYNKAPFDPETISGTGNYAQGLDYFMLPSLRSYGVNLKLNF